MRVSEHQRQSAAEACQQFWSRVLALDGPGPTWANLLGKARADRAGKPEKPYAARYADLIRRLAGGTYPSARILWEYALLLRERRWPWMQGPVMLFACGRLPEFVYAMVTYDYGLLDSSEVLRLVELLPHLLDRDSDRLREARACWTLPDITKGEVFLSPPPITTAMLRGIPDEIAEHHYRAVTAWGVATDFRIHYERQTETILKYLGEWAQNMIEVDAEVAEMDGEDEDEADG